VSSRNIELTPTLYDYLLAVGTRESADAAELRLATREATRWHRMQIGPEQGAFMALLARLTAARRILEVRTFTGYSALVTAEALPPEGRLITCDVSAEWTAVGRPSRRSTIWIWPRATAIAWRCSTPGVWSPQARRVKCSSVRTWRGSTGSRRRS
jgi:hypothetical protein